MFLYFEKTLKNSIGFVLNTILFDQGSFTDDTMYCNIDRLVDVST